MADFCSTTTVSPGDVPEGPDSTVKNAILVDRRHGKALQDLSVDKRYFISAGFTGVGCQLLDQTQECCWIRHLTTEKCHEMRHPTSPRS
jgi:hypothetical protein